jgi:hypothetical protein
VNSELPTPRRSWPRRLINRLEVDRATFFSIAARAWQVAAGPISMVLITAFFTDQERGYYYTFASLMALQALVELGLHAVVVNVASHEWADLELGTDGLPRGKPEALARLASLTRTAFRWYGAVSVIFAIAAGIAGIFFFRAGGGQGVNWPAPWVALVLLTAGTVWLWSLTALLEGCNQVAVVHRVRFLQACTGSLVVWGCMAAGAGLWTIVAAALVRLLWDLWLIGVRYRAFFRTLWSSPGGTSSFVWRDEVWPLQWRSGARSVVGYFASGLFVPIMFHFHGAVEAGRMGMTWTALLALEGAAYAWVQTRTAVFGMLAARRDFHELDRAFFRLMRVSTLMLALGSLLFCVALAIIGAVPLPFARKLAAALLPVGPTVLFCLALCLLHIPKGQHIYILAHKRDPLLIPGLLLTSLIAVAVCGGGAMFGAWGEATGYLAVIGLLYVPTYTWIWRRCRREWH